MSRDSLTKRRQFLQYAGVGSAALIAGCSALDSSQDDGNGNESNGNGNETDGEDGTDGEDETDDGEDSEDGGDGDPSAEQRTVGLSVSLNQEEQVQIQSISQQLQNEEISEEEATEQQTEIFQGGIDDLASELDGVSGAEIDEELANLGAVRLTGAPAGLIDSLELDRAESMVSEGALDTALSG